MEVFKTRKLAEEAKKTNPNYSTKDLTIKVKGGFAVMTARGYLNWLMQQ